jgi:hypothetical protein
MKANDNQGGSRMTQEQQIQAPVAPNQAITIRPAAAADAAAVKRLAQLDSAPPPTGEVLLAECGGEAVAAIELDSGSVIADPFRRTAEITPMLALRRRDLAGPLVRAPWWRRRIRSEEAAGRPGLAVTGT